MSELSEIWSFLFLSVAKLFNFSLDAICTIIFMVGSIPPWRWEETYLILNGQDQRHHGGWKGTCIAHLVITIGDLFLFVFALLSLTSPMRWAMLYDALFTPEQLNLRNTKRGRLFTLFPLTICDWFAYFFGFWGLFSPIGMQFFMFAAFRYPEVEFRKLDSAEVDRVMISVGCQTMLDLLIHVLGLPLILLAPSVWSGLYQGLVVINSLEPPERTLALENLWLEFYRTKRWLIAATACHAVIDIFTSPFLLLALLSPWRNSLIRALIWPPQPASTELVNAENSQVAATDRIIANNSTYQGVISSTRQAQLLELQQLQAIQAFDYHYNAVLRLNIMYQGLLAILDFFLLPMMLPLYFTQYRYRQMKEDLFGPSSTETNNKEDKNANRNTASIKIWTHRELFLILQQFSLLMSDMVLIALPLAVLFITRFRWNLVANIFKNYEEEKLFLKKSSLLYTVVLKQFVLLLLDGLCFPLVVIVFLTGYRWRVLSLLFANPKIKNSDLLMHGHIVMNFLLIFHDALIYSPIILVLGFLSLHRMVYSVLIIIDRLFHRDEVASKALSTPAFKDSDEVITQEQSYKLLKDETAVNTETSSPSRLDRDSSPSGQRVRLEEGMKVEGNDRGKGRYYPGRIKKNRDISEENTTSNIPPVTSTDHPTSDESAQKKPLIYLSVNYSYQTEWKFRSGLWKQAFQAIVDIPILFIALMNILTLWRCYEMFYKINRYIRSQDYPGKRAIRAAAIAAQRLPQTQAAVEGEIYQEIHSVPPVSLTPLELLRDIIVNEDDEKIRGIIFQQFLYVLRDFLCCFPLLLILVTLYRAPGLLMALITKARERVLTNIEPLWDVTHCSLEYKEGKDPVMTFRLKPNPKNPLTKGSSADKTSFGVIELKNYKLQILGKEMWEEAGNLFGGFLINLAKSFLPLKFKEGETLSWNKSPGEVRKRKEQKPGDAKEEKISRNKAVNYEPIRQNSIEEREETENEKVDFEGESLSPLARVIVSHPLIVDSSDLPSSIPVKVKEETKNEEEETVESEISFVLPLKQVKPKTLIKNVQQFQKRTRCLFQIECQGKGETTTTTDQLQWKDQILFQFPFALSDLIPIAKSGEGVFPTTRTSSTTGSRLPPAEKITIDESHFVDQFHGMILTTFFELLLDLGHFFLYFFTLSNPWRFYQLTRSLLSKNYYFIDYLVTQIGKEVQQMHEHLYAYRSSIAPIFNHVAKMETANRGAFQSWSYTLFSRYSYYYRYYDAYQPIVCSEESLLEEERVDDLERYAELGKAVFHSAQFLKKIYHPASSDDPIEKEARSLAAIEEKAEEVFALHDQMMTVWLLRYGNWIFLNRDPITRKQKDLLNIVMSERHDGVVRKMIRTKNEFEDYIETKKQMLLGLEPKEKKPIAKKEVSKRKRALFVNSIGETREIIRYFARKTFNDFGSLCLLILLFFTVVRLFPLFRDYYKDTIKYSSSSSSSSSSTSTSPSTASFTFHLKRQVGLLYIDVKDFLIFLFYFLILCITAVALPAFLSDVFQSHNLSSMKRLKICAKMHCNDFFWRLCEVLCLCFAFKTYKIAFKSTFYVLLLPSAGIAEALSLLKASTGIFVRFGLGILIYAGLFIGSVLVILQAIAIGDHSSDERDAVFQVNYSLFTIIIVTTMVMILLAWLKRHHQSRINPQGSTISSVPSAAGTTAKVMQTVSFQWSLWNHLISFIVPMTDCIQLSAVILFFFWNAVTPTNGNTNNNANTTSSSSYFLLDISNTHFGEDNLSILMYWSRQHSLLSSEISRETYNTGMTIAAFFGLIYILLVTLPIAYGGESEETRRREKILEIRNQNFYHILLILFQHFFTIWMLAMWMRPFSCLMNNNNDNGHDNAEEDTLVLSTAFSVSCGGTDVWSSRLSLVLLTYYLITSFVFYIEDRPSDTPTTAAATATATAAAAQRRRRNNASLGNRKIASRDELKLEHQLVYYDISYNILIKGYYTLMIMFCYVFFGIVPSSIILVIMMVFSLFVAVYPFLFSSFLVQSHLSPGGKSSNAKGSWLDRMNAYCTVPSLLPVRSCTFLGISWTCMICLIRITASNHAIFHQTVIFASEWVIYIGWILLFLAAAFLSRKVEDANAARWKDYLVQNGFTEVISGLERIYRHALIDSNCSTIMASSKPKKIDTKRILGQFSNRFQLTGQTGKSELESEESSKSNNPKRTNDHTPLMNYLEYQLFHQIRNERDLIYLLLQLEENISVEQLSTAFYQQRADWIQSLVDLANNPQPLLATSNTTSQPAPQRTITSQPTAIGLPNQQWDEFDTDALAVVGAGGGRGGGGAGAGTALGNTHVANATNVVLIPDIHDIENPRDSFTSKNQVQLLPSLSLLLNHMTILQTSLEDTIATTTLSWKLLEIVLSFHLPRDCCYVIHSFLIDVKEIHQFLFQEVFSTYQTLPLLYRVNNKSNKKKIPYGAWTGGNGFVNFTKDYYQTRNYLQETYGRLTQLYSNGSLQTKLIELFNKKNLF